jgi:hypothetical protein
MQNNTLLKKKKFITAKWRYSRFYEEVQARFRDIIDPLSVTEYTLEEVEYVKNNPLRMPICLVFYEYTYIIY